MNVASILIALFICTIINFSSSVVIDIPGPNNDLRLEQYLCPQSRTIPPNTVLVINEQQTISPGEFCLVENTGNITITGPQEAHVECLSNSTNINYIRGFGFLNVSNLHIDNIHFKNCGGIISTASVQYVNSTNAYYYYGPGQRASFLFNHCADLHLSKVTVSNYHGFSLIGVNLCGTLSFSEVVQRNRSSLSTYGIHSNDFSSTGSGTFIYFMDSNVTNACKTGNNSVFVRLISEGNEDYSPYINLYSDILNKVSRIPISSGSSSLGLTYGQTDFKVTSQFDLQILNNSDIFTVASNFLFANLDTQSSITLSGLYENNHGQLIKVAFSSAVSTSYDYEYYPVKFENLKMVSNRLKLGVNVWCPPEKSIGASNYKIKFRNVTWERNSRPRLLYVRNEPEQNSYLQVELENITAWNNNQSLLSPSSTPSKNSVFEFVNIHNVTILSNTYLSGDFVASCIRASSSNIYLSGQNLTFTNGWAAFGGALQLSDYNSLLYLVEPTDVLFSNNRAEVGSAIYAADTLRAPGFLTDFQKCTLEFVSNFYYTSHNITRIDISVKFIGNTEDNGAISLYAGVFSTLCDLMSPAPYSGIAYDSNSLLVSTNVNEHIFSFDSYFDAKLSFTNGICYSFKLPPTESDFNCTWTDGGITSPHNKTFSNPVLGLVHTYPGKRFLALYSSYRSVYSLNENKLWSLSHHTELLDINDGINPVQSLSVSLLNNSVLPMGGSEFYLYQYPWQFNIPGYEAVQLALVHVLDCPPGFTLSGSASNQCQCIKLLSQQNAMCDINTGLINLPNNVWVGFDNGTIYYTTVCPPTRCRQTLQVDLSTPDALCVGRHSGLVCGECADGYSVVFGANSCQVCSDVWSLTFFLYALAGILFVFVLFSLNLTVTSGTICGIIIYSNILGLSVDTLLSDSGDINPIPLRIFISLINLNLGFPICFYDGMTASVKSLLQFVFPVYLWILVIGLIVVCRFSTRIANRVGFNSVQVLATLLFFSYSKILSNVYTIFSFQSLISQNQYSNEIEETIVWFLDGRPYEDISHIALIFFAVAFTLLFLIPITFVLTFAFVLIRFRPVSKFQPLIDAYGGPFKSKYRFWVGVRLWVIVLVFLIFTILKSYNSSALYFAHSIVVMGLIVGQALVKPFKCKLCRALDLFYLLNYWLIAVSSTYLSSPELLHARTIVVTSLVSLAFVVFIGILLYQAYKVIKETSWFGYLKLKVFGHLGKKDDIKSINFSPLNDSRSNSVTISTASYDMYDPSRLRESILESVVTT